MGNKSSKTKKANETPKQKIEREKEEKQKEEYDRLIREKRLKKLGTEKLDKGKITNQHLEQAKSQLLQSDSITYQQANSEANSLDQHISISQPKIAEHTMTTINSDQVNKPEISIITIKEAPNKPTEISIVNEAINQDKADIPLSKSEPVLIQKLTAVKQIDKEHVAIEKIFRVCLKENDKFTYLEQCHAQLMSKELEIAFRLTDLNNIILAIIDHESFRPNILSYLIETYSRCIEMIERRYKHEFDERYQIIRTTIAYYISHIIAFGLSLNKTDIKVFLIKYLNETEPEDIELLFSDIIKACKDIPDLLKLTMSIVFNLFHLENIKEQNFYQLDKVRRNVGIVTNLLYYNDIVRPLYATEPNFFTKYINGKSFHNTFLGVLLGLSPFETGLESIKNTFNSMNNHRETEKQIKVQVEKLNRHIGDIEKIISMLLELPSSSEFVFEYFYELIRANMAALKIYSNSYTLSSMGIF
jgi:hypothetical protein